MKIARLNYLLLVFSLVSFHFVSAQKKDEKIQVGENVPVEKVQDITGEDISLSSPEKGKVLLSFYRYTACPICNIRIQEMISAYEELSSKGIQMVAVFENSQDDLIKYAQNSQIPFALVSDSEEKLYSQFFVEKSNAKFFKFFSKLNKMSEFKQAKKFAKENGGVKGKVKNRIHAEFLIDSKGEIEIAHYGKFAGDHIPLTELLR